MRNRITHAISALTVITLTALAVMFSSGTASAASYSVWDRVAKCESGGHWYINTGNGYYGGLQFTRGTWLAYGGATYSTYAHQTSRENQINIANHVLSGWNGKRGQGWQAWPYCSRVAGMR